MAKFTNDQTTRLEREMNVVQQKVSLTNHYYDLCVWLPGKIGTLKELCN